MAGGCAPKAIQPAKVEPPAAEGPATPSGQTAPPGPATLEPHIEQKALDILKASSDRLASARTMKFTAVVFYESPSRPGPALVYTTKSDVTLQRPDKLKVLTPGDGPPSDFYYNGKTMEAFSPAENFVAVSAAPPTIDDMLEAAYKNASIYFPFTDMIVADPYKDISDGLTLAFYIGQSDVIGVTTTDMVAYETGGTFVQVWIGAKDKLPRMARAVYRNDPLQLRHQVEFSNWQIDPVLPADDFSFPETPGAKRIPFARPDALSPPGIKPPAASEAPKTQ
ncbi:MAG: DUF2092 domain-containing protein [Desulfuromonadales bacterium]